MFWKKTNKISAEDVIWCFANILGRHPDSTSEIQIYLKSCYDFRELVTKIVSTSECVTRKTIAAVDFVYDDSDRTQRNIVGILKKLEPMKAVDHEKTRIGKEYDGGYIMLDDFDGITAAYSIGICNEVSWDLNIADRGINVYQYDHTIDCLPIQHPLFKWLKKGLGASVTSELDTLPGLIEKNGHQGRSDLILKCDIEGCEWEVLQGLPPECLRQFKQIVLEIHFLERLTDLEFATRAKRAIDVLTADHRVVHVHANNHRPYCIVGGFPLPSVLELTLARIHDVQLEINNEVFPSQLDTPCFRGTGDYRLGLFRF